MKLNFRDLKQQKFTIDAEPTDTVLQVKEKIATEKGWEASSQKLIYSGKILTDTNTVESYKIEEKGFIVCMISKPKAAPAAKPAPPATPQAAASTPAQPATPQQQSTAPVTNNPPATPSPAQVPASGGTGLGGESVMLVGNRGESAISEMEAMGFARADAEAALRAAYYNPDRAIEYLLNGIPEHIQREQEQRQQQAQAQTQAAQQGTTSPPATSTGAAATQAPAAEAQPSEEVNLFDAAAQAAQGQGARGGARAGAGAGAGLGAGLGAGAGAGAAAGAGQGNQVNMDFLRNSEHFQQLRQLVQQQPAMLEPILQQVAEGNPQLAQIISQNSEAFLQLLSEDINLGEGGEGGPGQGIINVTQEESDAIDRLCGLGFPRQRVIQAYFACDKNEELAANFLFEQPEDDD
ncbi:UV excision repair protein rad23 [Lithohypha guttulata]|uniref:UV excision repair protein rad23 n=1 Tax=Lithohypha guttulata TaxID=1690604 RepID=UPI002DE1A19E|nr:UV excision repair protein rad23 [Lithohypha guttulata]